MNEWLEQGMEILVEVGPSGLTIERLCQATGKTKGSFYHHFTGMDDFRRRLLEHWQVTHTEELMELSQRENPAESLRTLSRLTAHLPYAREVAFRLWAQHDAMAAKIVKTVDQIRTRYLQGLFEGLGLTPEDASQQAWFEYALFTGMAQLGLSSERRRKLRELLERKMR